MAERKSLTQRYIDSLPLPEKGKRTYYYDSKISGLGVCVTGTGARSFLVYRKHNGKPVRVTLGRYPDMTVQQARIEAQKALSKLSIGINPIDEKRDRIASVITLSEAFEDYIRARKSLKPSTVDDYRKTMKQTFSDWMNKPLASITKDKVRRRHEKRGKESKARANNAMRVLRAVFNFAAEVYEDQNGVSRFPSNPVAVLSKTKAWHKVERRKTYLPKETLPKWFDAVLNIDTHHPQSKAGIVREYLLFIFFTGTRREEAASLKWADVNLPEKVFTLKETKNSEVVTLPLCDYLVERLTLWRQQTPGEYLFPSDESRSGHIVSPHKQLERIKQKSGVPFTIHDLRRTFITVAEGLDISSYSIKRLVNHKTLDSIDVTAGYVVSDIDRLRLASEKVSQAILGAAKINQFEGVVPIRKGVF